LTAGQYSCPGCGLIFKNEKTMILRSIFLPGGGYFYTGHPLIASPLAVVEVILLADVLLIVVGGLASGTIAGLLNGLIVLGIFWGIETAVTILHCRRHIREYIPEKRDPVRMTQSTSQALR